MTSNFRSVGRTFGSPFSGFRGDYSVYFDSRWRDTLRRYPYSASPTRSRSAPRGGRSAASKRQASLALQRQALQDLMRQVRLCRRYNGFGHGALCSLCVGPCSAQDGRAGVLRKFTGHAHTYVCQLMTRMHNQIQSAGRMVHSPAASGLHNY